MKLSMLVALIWSLNFGIVCFMFVRPLPPLKSMPDDAYDFPETRLTPPDFTIGSDNVAPAAPVYASANLPPDFTTGNDNVALGYNVAYSNGTISDVVCMGDPKICAEGKTK